MIFGSVLAVIDQLTTSWMSAWLVVTSCKALATRASPHCFKCGCAFTILGPVARARVSTGTCNITGIFTIFATLHHMGRSATSSTWGTWLFSLAVPFISIGLELIGYITCFSGEINLSFAYIITVPESISTARFLLSKRPLSITCCLIYVSNLMFSNTRRGALAAERSHCGFTSLIAIFTDGFTASSLIIFGSDLVSRIV